MSPADLPPTMPMPPDGPVPVPTPTPTTADPGARRAARGEDPAAQAERRERLERVHGPGELSAAILALLLTHGSARETGVWRELTQEVPMADTLRRDVRALPGPARLPWLECLAHRMALQPVGLRQQLLQAARRMMGADGRTDPTDRMRWLTLRHLLTAAPVSIQPATEAELEALDEHVVQSIGSWSAFLSRLVPVPELDIDVAPEITDPGSLWWRAVMAPWVGAGAQRKIPDAGEVVLALQGTQTVPWMLRPAIVKRWLDAAQVLSPPGQLHPLAADALRMSARLLESPLPPALARCFIECDGRPGGD